MEKEIYNIYIDETCHLEADKFKIMCNGYCKINKHNYELLKSRIKSIKHKHNAFTEIKWNRLSYSRMLFYKELIDFFFESEVSFRAFLLEHKERLNHKSFNDTHNNFYYKMVYYLLNTPLNPNSNDYRVYLDIKDTRGKEKLNKINTVFQNKYYGKSPFIYFQHIHSHENEFIQLSDLFIGAIGYKARGEHLNPKASQVKVELINYIESKTGFPIDKGTDRHEPKFNIFLFTPQNKSINV